MSFHLDLERAVTVGQAWWEEHGTFWSHPAWQELCRNSGPSPREAGRAGAELGGRSSISHVETVVKRETRGKEQSLSWPHA